MKAERQYKEPDSRLIQSKSQREVKGLVDNRSYAIEQCKLVNVIQQKETIGNFGDSNKHSCFNEANVLQRSRQHVEDFGCLQEEAVDPYFRPHIFVSEGYSVEYSEIRGITPHTVIKITDKQLAEEIAAELYGWEEGETPPVRIDITTRGMYESTTYKDGKVKSSRTSSIKVTCQLRTRADGSSYYQVYHFEGFD